MTTATSLRSQTAKELAQRAKAKGVKGWHSMRKEQLVDALLRVDSKSKSVGKNSRRARRAASGQRVSKASTSRMLNAKSRKGKANPRVNKIIRERTAEQQRRKDLAQLYQAGKSEGDGIVLIVRDAYWLQACWSIQPQTVQRCQVALAEEWHQSEPVIRLFKINDRGSTHGVEDFVRDIPVHGGVRNWYIDVDDPPADFRVALGYRTASNRFHLVAKSNTVSTPYPGQADAMKGHWEDIAENYQKFFSQSGGYNDCQNTDELRRMFEEQLQRPMDAPNLTHVSSAYRRGNLDFDVDAELIVFGSVEPNTKVSIAGDPVQVQPDGSFSVQLSLPDRRQVLPVVARSRDGSQQRTTVLAIEKNTKFLEAVNCEPEDL